MSTQLQQIAWRVTTGSETWRARGPDAFTATVCAFRKRTPKCPGLVTQVVGPDGVEWYVSTLRALSEAGYEVEAS